VITDGEEGVNVGEMLGSGGGIIGHGQMGLVVINGHMRITECEQTPRLAVYYDRGLYIHQLPQPNCCHL